MCSQHHPENFSSRLPKPAAAPDGHYEADFDSAAQIPDSASLLTPQRLPGNIPTILKYHDLVIRAYQPEDDPYLMELERLSPRGEPRPFYHFRRRFIDRAMLYARPYLFVAEKDGRPVGVTSVAIKDTQINGERVTACYSFDTRVHPAYRRMGIANAMQEEKQAFFASQGAHMIYTLVVATNLPSIKMLEKIGYKKNRQTLLLTFPPYPQIFPPEEVPYASNQPDSEKAVIRAFARRDLFIDHVAQRLSAFNYQCFSLKNGSDTVSMSIFDQSMVYQAVSADEPMPTEEEISTRARSWRLFDEVGTRHPATLRAIFDHIRDLAVGSNVAKLSILIDRIDPVPGFLFEESTQTDYWMLSYPLVSDWEPQWNFDPIYMDPRDL